MPATRLHSRILIKLSPILAAWICFSLASLGLFGQIFNITVMKVLIVGYPAMSMSTAICLMSLSIGLIAASTNISTGPLRTNVIAISTSFVVIMAVTNLSVTLFHLDRASLLSLFGLPPDIKILIISSPYTAACLILLAISLVLQNSSHDRRGVQLGQDLAAFALIVLSFVALGYLFSISIFFRINTEIGMALHTWLSLLVLSIGTLNLKKDIGLPAFYYGQGIGSVMLRGILPVFGLVIVVIALLGEKYVHAALLETQVIVLVVVLTFVVATRALWHIATKLNKIERELMIEHAKFLELFEGNPDAILVFDVQGRVTEANHQAIQLTGYSRETLLGMGAEQFVNQSQRLQHEALRMEFMKAPHPRKMGSGLDLSLLRADGTECFVDISIRPAVIEGHRMTILSLRDQSDIRRMKKKIEALDYDAYHDALTALPNRRMITSHLQQIINHAERYQLKAAVCYCDLDGFKSVNDTFGHRTGDALLIEAANRIRACIRGEDVASRLGGDEFVVVLSEVTDMQGAVTVIQKLIDHIAQPYQLGTTTCSVTVSVGISFYPDHGSSPEELIQGADAAMYHSKTLGKNQFQFAI